MIDTIRIGYKGKDLMEKFRNSDIKNIGENRRHSYKFYFENDKEKVTRIFVDDKKFSLETNMPILLYGSNIFEINVGDIEKFIHILSSEYNLPIEELRIYRIDFGINIPTKYPASIYLDSFFEKERCWTNQWHGSTKQFENSKRSIKLYDKRKQISEKYPHLLPLIDGHLLRIEIKINSEELRNKLFDGGLYLTDLLKKTVREIFLDYFKEEFLSINTLPHFDFKLDKTMHSPLKNNLACLGMDYIGGIPAVFEIINRMEVTGKISRQKKVI